MKRVIRFLIISLAPIAIHIAFSNLYFLARAYTSTHYDMLPLFITAIAGYALIGTAIIFICRNTLKAATMAHIPFEFLVGIVLVIFPFLSLFIQIPLPMFCFPDMSSGLAVIGLFTGVYICLFVAVLRRQTKAQKSDQSATSSDKASE